MKTSQQYRNLSDSLYAKSADLVAQAYKVSKRAETHDDAQIREQDEQEAEKLFRAADSALAESGRHRETAKELEFIGD